MISGAIRQSLQGGFKFSCITQKKQRGTVEYFGKIEACSLSYPTSCMQQVVYQQDTPRQKSLGHEGNVGKRHTKIRPS